MQLARSISLLVAFSCSPRLRQPTRSVCGCCGGTTRRSPGDARQGAGPRAASCWLPALLCQATQCSRTRSSCHEPFPFDTNPASLVVGRPGGHLRCSRRRFRQAPDRSSYRHGVNPQDPRRRAPGMPLGAQRQCLATSTWWIFGRPRCLPCARARCTPAITRSRIRSRSNSAKTASIPNRLFLSGVDLKLNANGNLDFILRTYDAK